MAEGKKSFLMYTDTISVVDKLTDEEAGRLFKHLLRYVNDLNPTPPDRLTELLFEPIKLALKRDLSKWEEKTNNFSDAGKESAKSRRLTSGTQLYVLKFYNDDEEFLKIGITDSSIGRRYSSSGEGGSKVGYKFDILYQYFQFENGISVIDLEGKIRLKFNSNSYIPSKKFGGYTECYDIEVLDDVIDYLTTFNDVQQRSSFSTVSVNDIDTVSVIDSDIEINKFIEQPRSNRFIKPSLAEIESYCNVRGNNVNPTKFFNHYESNGWMVGKNKMKDWEAAVRTWEQSSTDTFSKVNIMSNPKELKF